MAVFRLISSKCAHAGRVQRPLASTFTPVSTFNKCQQRSFTQHPRLQALVPPNSQRFQVSEEVRAAVEEGRPVVALESTIYTHGYPYPDNLELAKSLEDIARSEGAVPATIAIMDGVAKVGLSSHEISRITSLAGDPETVKVSRRDLAFACSAIVQGKPISGGSTVSATMILAHRASIPVFATGGLGGVHRGAEKSMDVSADLTELGRTPVAVVSSGCKSFLDIEKTLEYLETQGVGVVTFARGRPRAWGSVQFPAFWARDSRFQSPMAIDHEKEAASIILAQQELGIQSGLVFANPVPEESAMDSELMDRIIEQALEESEKIGIRGKLVTPFVLAKIKEISQGQSIIANRALIEDNVRCGASISRELAMMKKKSGFHHPLMPNQAQGVAPKVTEPPISVATRGDSNKKSPTIAATPIVVAGAVAVDNCCDLASRGKASPQLHTSNPAQISQSVGGVGHNIAKAVHLISGNVTLCSAIADDFAGSSILSSLDKNGMSVTGIMRLSQKDSRTAQYIAINDGSRDLYVAMADMSILEQDKALLMQLETWKKSITRETKWLVLDGNWSTDMLETWISEARKLGVRTAIEPVSVAKSRRIVAAIKKMLDKSDKDALFPLSPIRLITPNIHELSAIHDAASEAGLLESEDWFGRVDSLNLPSAGSRELLSKAVGSELVDSGAAQMCIQLLPYFGTIAVTLGPRGVLVASIVTKPGAELALGTASVSMNFSASTITSSRSSSPVSGLYLRLFKPGETLDQDEIVSVNGAGDTFMGALISGLAQAPEKFTFEEAVSLAQTAARLSLRDSQSVPDSLSEIR